MRDLANDATVADYRNALMQFLNEYGLEGTAILSLARRAAPVGYAPGECVLEQGHFDRHLYFLVQGNIVIGVTTHGREEVLGNRSAVTLLGEISYFNDTPATATVRVRDDAPATFLRLSYDDFTAVLDAYPQIKTTLGRIGEMRMISQMDGFTSYPYYMDMIGRKRDRLALNRSLTPYLEDTLKHSLLPRLNGTPRILDVGDGPGIVCEMLREQHPEWDENLFLQATYLEDAILDPLQSFPSDFSRATYLRERFDAITALQVFDRIEPTQIGAQFRRAATLLNDGGLLLVVRLRLVDVTHASGRQDTTLFYEGLEGVVERVWPGILNGAPLITVTFLDADIDPMMEWNALFRDKVANGEVTLPAAEQGAERVLLEVLLRQAGHSIFDPEEVHFHWLVWHAAHHGLRLEASEQRPDVGFYYQLYARDAAADPA